MGLDLKRWFDFKPTSFAQFALSIPRKTAQPISGRVPFFLVIAAIISGVATYVALTNTDYLSTSPKIVLVLINADIVLLLLLGVVVSRKLVEIWAARRRGLAGSRLHVKLVMLFGLLAVTPAIIMAVFSVLFFDFGLQAWFSDRVDRALNNSLAVADAYLKEHRKLISGDALSIGKEFIADIPLLQAGAPGANEKLTHLTRLRSVPEAIIFDVNHQILARSNLTFTLEFEMIPQWAVERANGGDVVVLANEGGDRVRALMILDRPTQTFLYIGRFVDPKVLNYHHETLSAVNEYNQLKGKQSEIEIRFALIFALVALLLLLVAIWVGLTFATQLSRPIRRLVMASEKIRQGDLRARVDEDSSEEELLSLSRSFNRMAAQLESQRGDLVEVNLQLDLRRQFTESVLRGVSAGVVGLNKSGKINLANRSAAALLEVALEDLEGKKLMEVAPEMMPLFKQVKGGVEPTCEEQVTLSRHGVTKTLLVRVVLQQEKNQIQGYVVTFDDMTDLLAAQRKAAWSDVARRIAHEIKNPLTPIQLSAERLQRKYKDEISTDPEVFEACTDTIIRQVEDIGRMVDEFSTFARMPLPVMATEDLAQLCERALFLQHNAHTGLNLRFIPLDKPLLMVCDRRLITQALTNLLQNAIDSVYSILKENEQKEGVVALSLVVNDWVRVIVQDNGKGLPLEMIDRLTEPYVTTKLKGTGLGLAIVKKIMEDHGGRLLLTNIVEGGARVELLFPLSAMLSE
jgi:two-component system nitrogen regulation sensor histidine kinase NtrY